MRALAIAAILLPCLAAGPAEAADLVRLGNLQFIHYGAVAYMKEIAPRHGLVIEEKMFAKGLDVMPALAAGEVDIAASSLDAAVAGRAGGIPIVAVAGFAKGGLRVVGRADLGLGAIADLRGHTVGVVRGGDRELVLLAELAKHGLSWSDRPGKDVRLVFLPSDDLNHALADKRIDAMVQSEPQATQAIASGAGKEMVKPYDTELGEPERVLVMTETLYATRPDVAARVVQCLVEATAAFKADPRLAETYVRETFFAGRLSAAEYRDAMANVTLATELPIEHIQVTTDLMKKFGIGKMAEPPVAASWTKLDLLARATR